MNLSDEKYSADDMDGSNQVSVPIMMSGWRLSSRTSRSGFLFFMERKFMVSIFRGRFMPFVFFDWFSSRGL